MLPTLLFAGALAAPSPEEVTAAVERVDKRAPAVEYALLLDTSPALLPESQALLPEVARLIEVAPVGDAITLITFSNRPYEVLPRTVITAAGRSALAEKVRTLSLPSGFDRDLGDGLHTLAEHLADPQGSEFVHVLGVSNFCHSPTVTSPWSSGGRGCGTIRNQARIGAVLGTVRASGRVHAAWFPVNAKDAPVDPAGAAAAIHEIGGELITDAPKSWLQTFVSRLPAERARPVALADARAPGFSLRVAGPVDEAGTVPLEVTGTTRALDLTLTHLEATGIEGPLPAELPLTTPAQLAVVVKVPRPPWSLFPRQDSVNVEVTLSADGTLGPAPAVDLWGIRRQTSRLTATISVPVERKFGLPLGAGLGVLAATFLTAAGGAVLIRGKLMPLRLGGTIAARFRGGPRQELPVAERAEAAIVLDPDGRARVGKREEASVVLRVRRPWWTLYGEVHIRVNEAEINGRPAKNGIHKVVPGATSIRAGDWRLTWE